jgi:molybdopterin/thiamine biosynthesis adenylyltransferase
MYAMEAQLTTFVPGRSPCLACLYPVEPPAWKRQFPVFGAVAGVIGSLAAVEAIKSISGLAEPLIGKLLTCNLAEMAFRTLTISRNPNCSVCGDRHR